MKVNLYKASIVVALVLYHLHIFMKQLKVFSQFLTKSTVIIYVRAVCSHLIEQISSRMNHSLNWHEGKM